MRAILIGLVLCLAVVFVGCNQPTAENKQPNANGSKYLLTSEPEGAKDVIEVRKNAKDKEEVVIVGRIGGDKNPWVEGRAAFSIVDLSGLACSDREGDNCPTPWDYCCEADLGQKTALIRVVDEQGNLIKQDAKKLFGVKELDTVVVQGTAQRSEKGNLTVLAKALYVKK